MFARESLANPYISYGTETVGTSLKAGIPLREDLSMQLRYSIYWQQIQLQSSMDDCNNINPDFATSFPTWTAVVGAAAAGLDREAPLPNIAKSQLSRGMCPA